MPRFVDIPLAAVKLSGDNARVVVECEALAADMKKRGLLQPIIVRHTPGSRDRYDLVAGHRRFAAARKLKWEKIACHVLMPRKKSDKLISDRELVTARASENLQRDGLSSYEIAMSVRQLKDVGLKSPEVSEVTGLSRSAVRQYNMLTNVGRLAPEVLRLWRDRDARLTLPVLIDRVAPAHEHDAQLEVLRVLGLEARKGQPNPLAGASGDTTGDNDRSPRTSKLTPNKIRKILAWMETQPEYVQDSAGRCIIATLRWSLGQTRDIQYSGDGYARDPVSAYQASEKQRQAKAPKKSPSSRRGQPPTAPETADNSSTAAAEAPSQ
jgi:ParB/RepB/Spo0J family partition protein